MEPMSKNMQQLWRAEVLRGVYGRCDGVLLPTQRGSLTAAFPSVCSEAEHYKNMPQIGLSRSGHLGRAFRACHHRSSLRCKICGLPSVNVRVCVCVCALHTQQTKKVDGSD